MAISSRGSGTTGWKGRCGRSCATASIRLFVRPGVGPRELGVVTDAFLTALESSSGAEQVMSRAWREAGVLSAERQDPIVLASGKIRPVHTLARPREREAKST